MKKSVLALAIMMVATSGAIAQNGNVGATGPSKSEPALKKVHCKESSGEIKKVNSRLDPKVISEDGFVAGNVSVLSVGGSFAGSVKR